MKNLIFQTLEVTFLSKEGLAGTMIYDIYMHLCILNIFVIEIFKIKGHLGGQMRGKVCFEKARENGIDHWPLTGVVTKPITFSTLCIVFS